MHEHYIEDSKGDLTDVVTFCSDSCHRDWHDVKSRGEYEGWNGSHEGSTDYNSYCAQCGVICGCGPEACDHQRENVLVNRFPTKKGERCEHGNWIQLPSTFHHNRR